MPEDPYLSRELDRYFPDRLSRRFAELLGEHRLRREIIVTATTNSIVNRMGPAFAMRTQEDTGADVGRIARAYSIAREITGHARAVDRHRGARQPRRRRGRSTA